MISIGNINANYVNYYVSLSDPNKTILAKFADYLDKELIVDRCYLSKIEIHNSIYYIFHNDGKNSVRIRFYCNNLVNVTLAYPLNNSIKVTGQSFEYLKFDIINKGEKIDYDLKYEFKN